MSRGKFQFLISVVFWQTFAGASCFDKLSQNAVYHNILHRFQTAPYPAFVDVARFQTLLDALYKSESISRASLERLLTAANQFPDDPLSFLSEKIVQDVRGLAVFHQLKVQPIAAVHVPRSEKFDSDEISAPDFWSHGSENFGDVHNKITKHFEALFSRMGFKTDQHVDWLLEEPEFRDDEAYFEMSLDLLRTMRSQETLTPLFGKLCREMAKEYPERISRIKKLVLELPVDEFRWVVGLVLNQEAFGDEDYDFLGKILNVGSLKLRIEAARALNLLFKRDPTRYGDDQAQGFVAEYLDGYLWEKMTGNLLMPLFDRFWFSERFVTARLAFQNRRPLEYRWLVREAVRYRVRQLPWIKSLPYRLGLLRMAM